ncbi:MAG: hypothetical protein V9E96_03915 [Chitinophagaceae bacterium]|jgi:hypothetical protein|nr:hypothetical protein [Chitinophagaceae bacterium]MBP9741528.1 hypothetical protein [Chitinophagaceae bacterium]
MKKFTIAILSILYFAMTSGIVLNIHYCRGKISSVKVDLLAKQLCECKKKPSKSCCKTEHKLVKLEDNHKASYTSFQVEAPVATIFTDYFVESIPVYSTKNLLSYSSNSPPLIPKEEIYIKNCVFRI